MGTETYLRTWRHLRVRFYTAAFISFVCFLLNIGFLVGRKQALFALAAWFGAEVAWTVLFIVWVMWFKCPRCRRNFSFSSKRIGMFSCVHCRLPIGTEGTSESLVCNSPLKSPVSIANTARRVIGWRQSTIKL